MIKKHLGGLCNILVLGMIAFLCSCSSGGVAKYKSFSEIEKVGYFDCFSLLERGGFGNILSYRAHRGSFNTTITIYINGEKAGVLADIKRAKDFIIPPSFILQFNILNWMLYERFIAPVGEQLVTFEIINDEGEAVRKTIPMKIEQNQVAIVRVENLLVDYKSHSTSWESSTATHTTLFEKIHYIPFSKVVVAKTTLPIPTKTQQYIFNNDAILNLITILKNESDWGLRVFSSRMLTAIRDPNSIEQMKEVFSYEKDVDVREHIRDAIDEATEKI